VASCLHEIAGGIGARGSIDLDERALRAGYRHAETRRRSPREAIVTPPTRLAIAAPGDRGPLGLARRGSDRVACALGAAGDGVARALKSDGQATISGETRLTSTITSAEMPARRAAAISSSGEGASYRQ
jgi:hypothetical protein